MPKTQPKKIEDWEKMSYYELPPIVKEVFGLDEAGTEYKGKAINLCQLLKFEKDRRKKALLKQAKAFEFMLKQARQEEKEKLLERIENFVIQESGKSGRKEILNYLEKLKEEIKKEL